VSAESGELFCSILDAVLPNGGWVIPVWHAYFDESGHRTDSKVLVVGGYVIRKSKAKTLDKLWRGVLRKYDLPYFHMVDCAHGNKHHARLSGAENIALETELIGLIKQYAEMGVATIIAPDRYEARPEDEDTYVFAVRILLAVVAHELKRIDRTNGPVALFFEDGHDSEKKAARVVREHREHQPDTFKSYTFGGKADFPLLQMADLFVWHLAKYVKDKVEGKRPRRKDYDSLTQQDHHHVYLGRKGNKIMTCDHLSAHYDSPDVDVFIKHFFTDDSSPDLDPAILAFNEWAERLEREGR
jgi:hypothetical protein